MDSNPHRSFRLCDTFAVSVPDAVSGVCLPQQKGSSYRDRQADLQDLYYIILLDLFCHLESLMCDLLQLAKRITTSALFKAGLRLSDATRVRPGKGKGKGNISYGLTGDLCLPNPLWLDPDEPRQPR